MSLYWIETTYKMSILSYFNSLETGEFLDIVKVKDSRPHIIVLLDMSGSMSYRTQSIIENFNKFLSSQKEISDESVITLILFNRKMTVVYDRAPISDAKPLTRDDYVPTGTTALNDCIGSILDVYPYDQPTLFVIMTDGMNNVVLKYTHEMVKEMIAARVGEDMPSNTTADNAGLIKTSTKWKIIYISDSESVRQSGENLGIVHSTSQNPSSQNVCSREMPEVFQQLESCATHFRRTGNSCPL